MAKSGSKLLDAQRACWFLKHGDPPIFVLLGRLGDEILMFPAYREIWRRTGHKPEVIVSHEYAQCFEGITYAKAIPVGLHWYDGIPQAKAMAEARGAGCCIPQWWNSPCPIPQECRGSFTLQCHGRSHGVNLNLWPNFMASMYERAGFTQQEMLRLPLVFDRRNTVRERELVERLWPPAYRKKPLLLYNFTGISSPFGYTPELFPVLNRFRQDFHMIDLGQVRAHRIFDLLSIMEQAVGMLHCDSAPLHLAHATKTPYIAFSAKGWTGSTPRGNVALQVMYDDTPRRLNEIAEVLENWKSCTCDNSHLVRVPA